MKGMDLFCSSSASTAVNSSTYHRSMARKSTKRHASVRRKSQLHVPCSSKLPINPKPHHEKHRKSSTEKQNSDISRKNSVTRYLLSDIPFIDWVPESDKISAMVPTQVTQPSHNSTQDQVIIFCLIF